MSMKKSRNDYGDAERLNGVSWILIVLAALFAISGLIPLLVNRPKVVDFVRTGPIGDTVTDIMAPLISIASVSMMFLAFYMQYVANKLVNKQFERGQFETRFFELLKMHKENSIVILNSLRGGEDEALASKAPELYQLRRFELIITRLNNAYGQKRQSPKEAEKRPRSVFTEVWSDRWEDSFGHYFRHLFQLVRFVASREFLTYEQKRGYMRIVRASLSTYEQIFLYYDWLSGDGRKWEDDENRYFSDYRVIHNINPELLIPDLDIRKMSPFRELMASGDYMKERGRESDELFEFESRSSRL
jgi:uncharacterized membrane protein